MLTYKKSLYIFSFLLITLIGIDYFFDITKWSYLILLAGYSLILFYGSYFIHSNFFIVVPCKSDNSRNMVALTFDDGPVEEKTSTILDTLKKNNVKATFFCIGNRITKQPELIKRIIEEGHLIGNHSYSHHFFFDLFTKNRMKEELKETNRIVLEITGHKPNFFRPPYGVTTPVLAGAINECGMQPVGWSLRSMDTVTGSENKLIEKIKGNIKSGDIVLLHDTASVTVSSLQKIIDAIRLKGLEPVRVDELIKIKAYA